MSKWLKCAMVACTLAVTAATTVPAAADTFIKLADFKGDATFKGHEGEVNVLSWGWSASQTRNAASGMASGRAIPGDLTITKTVDGTTPLLVEAVMTGKTLPSATLTVVNAAGDRTATSVKIVLTGVNVTSVSVAPAGSTGNLPVEQITLAYATLEYSVTPADRAGRPGATVTYKYDARAGR